MYIRLIVLALSLFLAGGARTFSFSDSLKARFDRQRSLFPQEKIHQHTDRTCYMPGERVYFRTYVVDATDFRPDAPDKYVYTELLDRNGYIIKRVKTICGGKAFAGYLDIPSDIAPAVYFLRSYTLYSSNVHGYDCLTPISVGGARLQFPSKHLAVRHDEGILDCKDEGRYFGIGLSKQTKGTYRIAVISRGQVVYDDTLSAPRRISFLNSDMPQGVSSVIVYDSQRRILGRRLIFSPYGDRIAHVQISVDSVSLSGHKNKGLTISVPGVSDCSLSVSVTDNARTSVSDAMTIMPRLLLSSDIRGTVPDADSYFRDGYHAEALDSLLRSSVSDRYNVDSILAGIYSRPIVFPETSQTANGRAIIPGNTVYGASDATVNIISPQADMFSIVRADKNGRFAVSGLDYPDGTSYVFNAFTANRRDKTEVRMDETAYPPVDETTFARYAAVPFVHNGHVVSDFGKSIMLDNVTVTTSRRKSHSGTFSSLADYSLTAEDMNNIDATCIHEVLRRIPGVRVKNDNRCYIRTGTSIYDDTPAAIAIDGIIVDYNYDLDILNLHDIARVDIFKSGSAVIWGAAGGAGVISVTTKNGTRTHDGDVPNRISRYTPLGYQIPVAEFRTKQNKNVKTVYWNGSLEVTDGKAHIDSLLPQSQPYDYTVRVEGITSDGRIVCGEIRLTDK